MGEYANGIGNKIVSCILCVVVIVINISFVIVQVNEAHLHWGYLLLVGNVLAVDLRSKRAVGVISSRSLSVVFGVLYILFNLYLVVHMTAFMGNQRVLNSSVSSIQIV